MKWPRLNSENIAVFSNVPLWANRHPEGLEIAWHYAEDNTIHWVNCAGALASCPANKFHSLKTCRSCVKQTSHITSNLLPTDTVVHSFQPERISLESALMPSSFLELVDFQYKKVPVGGMVASQLADDAHDRFFEWNLISQRAIALLESSIELYEWSSKFLSDNSITSVFVWNGRRPSDGPMVYAARDQGLNYFTVISDEIGKLRLVPDTSIHSSRGLERALSLVRLEGLSTTDMERASAFLAFLRYGTTTDWTLPWFAKGKSRAFKRSNSRPILAIFTSSPFERIGLRDFAIAETLSSNILGDPLEEICSRSRITSSWQVVVRFHPNLKDCGFSERSQMTSLKSRYQDVTFIMPEDCISSYDILEQAEVVVTFGSTIGVEATWYGKPSLLMGRAVHENAGVCTRLGTVDDLESTLANRDFRVIAKDNVTQYLVAERNTHLPMQYIQMDSHYSYVNGVKLVRSSPMSRLKGSVRFILRLLFSFRQAQLRRRLARTHTSKPVC